MPDHSSSDPTGLRRANWLLVGTGTVSFAIYVALAGVKNHASNVPELVLAQLTLFCLMALACWAGSRKTGQFQLCSRTILVFAFLFRLALVWSEPTLSDDIYRYIWDGRVQLAGVNPYRYAPEDPALSGLRDALYHKINHREVPTIYPPASQLVFAALAAIDPGVREFKLGLCLLELASVWILAELLKRIGRPAGCLALYAWNPLVVVETAGSGHAECVASLLALSGLLALHHGMRARSGALLGAALFAKLYPAFFAPAWLPSLRWRGMLALGATGLILCAPYWTGDASPLVGLGTFAEHWNHNEFVYRVLLWLSPNRDIAKLVAVAAFLLVACTVMLRTRQGDTRSVARSSLWLLFWMLCLSPTVHPWYVAWLAPWIALTPRMAPLLWTATVPLTYEILLRYHSAGVWTESAWVVELEYGAVIAGLVADLFLHRARRARSSKIDLDPTKTRPAAKSA